MTRGSLKDLPVNDQILLLADVIVRKLEGQLPADEYGNGWTEESRHWFLGFFRDLQAKVASGEEFSQEEVVRLNIAKAIDSCGIVGGDLLELGSRIWLLLRDYRSAMNTGRPQA